MLARTAWPTTAAPAHNTPVATNRSALGRLADEFLLAVAALWNVAERTSSKQQQQQAAFAEHPKSPEVLMAIITNLDGLPPFLEILLSHSQPSPSDRQFSAPSFPI
jgi:hypothetical protein